MNFVRYAALGWTTYNYFQHLLRSTEYFRLLLLTSTKWIRWKKKYLLVAFIVSVLFRIRFVDVRINLKYLFGLGRCWLESVIFGWSWNVLTLEGVDYRRFWPRGCWPLKVNPMNVEWIHITMRVQFLPILLVKYPDFLVHIVIFSLHKNTEYC